MKLLIVGQAPSRAMQPGDKPLWGTGALTRLASYAGISPRERLYDLADFTNVIEEYPGPQPGNPKYDAFPAALATQGCVRAADLIAASEYTHVVTLGSAVRSLLASHRQEWFTWSPWLVAVAVRKQLTASREVELACSPHPGGTSMWWNDPRNLAQGRQFWSNLFRDVDSSRRSVAPLGTGSSVRTNPDALL